MRLAVSLRLRRRATHRALHLLRRLAGRKSTFAKYSGHLLPAFYFIATTSRDATLRRSALDAGRERARYWKQLWHGKRRRLDAANVLDEISAGYAAEQLGISHRTIRRQLETAVARYSPRELFGFDPRFETIPRDIPDDCECGAVNQRGRRRCRTCRRRVTLRSRYQAWYYALIGIYFCEQYGMRLPVSYADVMSLLPALQPYPPARSRDYRDAIYAITHIVYTLNDYNRSRLPARQVRRERAFLKASLPWAIRQGEADTVGEILDSLAGCGLADTDPLMVKGRTFLLEQQRDDGGWGDEDDEYGRFHSVWTGIDGLREYRWSIDYHAAAGEEPSIDSDWRTLMARKRAGKTSRLDNAAIAAGSALGALAKKIDDLTSRREAISTQLQRLVEQAENKLRSLAGGKKSKGRAKAKAKAGKKR